MVAELFLQFLPPDATPASGQGALITLTVTQTGWELPTLTEVIAPGPTAVPQNGERTVTADAPRTITVVRSEFKLRSKADICC